MHALGVKKTNSCIQMSWDGRLWRLLCRDDDFQPPAGSPAWVGRGLWKGSAPLSTVWALALQLRKNGQCTPATTSLAGFILGGFYVNGDETETKAGVFLIRRYKGQRTLPGATSDPASYSDAFRSHRILNRCTKFFCLAYSEFIFHQIAAAYSPHPLSHRLNSAVIHCKADLI